jgi:antitoxin HicB
MSNRTFKVILEWNNDDQGYTVVVPALPGCITQGDNVQEALDNAREAIEGFIEAMKIKGIPIPESDVQMFFGEVSVAL